MSTPPQQPDGPAPGPRFDDPTRDIRLPSLPDRPPAAVRPEWEAHVRTSAADPAPAPTGQAERAGDAPVAPVVTGVGAVVHAAGSSSPPRPYVLPNEPTDELPPPPPVRQQTLAFDAPAGPPQVQVPGGPGPGGSFAEAATPDVQPSAASGHEAPSPALPASAPGVAAGRSRGRWAWMLLALLPILVIVVAGVLLFLLLGGV